MCHRGPPILTGVGDRKCEFDGCNALEFRTSGFCLRHKGGSPDEENPVITGTHEKNSRKAVTEDWRIHFFALGYVPFAILLVEFDYRTDEEFGLWRLVSLMNLFLFFLLPIYADYLVRINRQRKENGTRKLALTIFYLFLFIVPLLWLLLMLILSMLVGVMIT